MLKTPPYEVTIDTTKIDCRIQTAGGTDVSSALGSAGNVKVGATGTTTVAIALNAPTTNVAMSTTSVIAGTSGTMTMAYTLTHKMQSGTWIYMTLPKANVMYSSGNSATGTSFVTDALKATGSLFVGGVSIAINTSSSYVSLGSLYSPDIWAIKINDASYQAAAGSKVEVKIPVTMPPVVTAATGLLNCWQMQIKTSLYSTGTTLPTQYADTEISKSTALTTSGLIITTTRPRTVNNKMAITGNLDGISVAGATYSFELSNQNPIPTQGVLEITCPSSVSVSSVAGWTMTCTQGCVSGAITLTSSGQVVTATGAFTSYVATGTTIKFTIKGWTNPSDSNAAAFTVTSKAKLNNVLYGIEVFSGMSITAQAGICTIQDIYVTDGDTRIYAQVVSYTFKMWCNHEVTSTHGIQVTFPSTYIIKNVSSCTFTGYNTRYYCLTYSSTRIIEVRQFTTSTIAAKTLMTFTFNSIINPGTYGATGAITVKTLDSTNTAVDTGTYTMTSGYFTAGNITTFSVTPDNSAVGSYPVKYKFNIIPNGEVARYGYLEIALPAEIEIVNERDFEDTCGESVYGFTNTKISCVVTNGGRTIQVKDGFLLAASTNLTDADGLYYPPDLLFTLNGFQNPRVAGFTSAWNVTIKNEWDKVLYYWNQTDSPTLYVSGVAAPKFTQLTYGSKKNGALTWLEFLVTTTGGVGDGDKVLVKLPYGWQFAGDAQVLARSENLANVMASTTSVDARQIEFTVEVAAALKRQLSDQAEEGQDGFLEGRRELARIASGYSYAFRITNMKNFNSFRPADASIGFYVYSAAGILFEESVSGMMMQNTELGDLLATKNGIVPSDFRTDFEANYTLTVEVGNFEKNMAFTVYLPAEIDFGDEDPYCTGLSGTDNKVLRCDADRAAKTLKFTNAMQFAQANPGPMGILIEKLRNPSENVVTGSFLVKTESYDGYAMDELSSDMTINFYCEYPCAACPQGAPSTCEECYQTSVERYFHEAKCLAECPRLMVETDELGCTDCLSPCVTCEGSPTFCTECIDGYYVVDGGLCREEVTWYFPFVGMALAFFILITVSEIVTKRASNFKESLIAFWSIPEVLAWGCLIWFMWHRQGQSEATSLAALAAIMYVCINTVHAIFHPRYMVPNTLYSYKQLLTDYKCGTFIARAISYMISFKFSLILVSHFFGSARLKGDYSAMNWKQFNRFSLAYCLFPYSCMMASCVYFIMTDGFWSYPGFVAAEVVCLSSIVTMLLAIDAISAIKCKTVGKLKTNRAIRVATGADYESDEDEMNLKKQVTRATKTNRVKAQDEFGVGESEYDSEEDSVRELVGAETRRGDERTRKSRAQMSHYGSEGTVNSKMSAQTAMMNEEARKQIAMLEELAHQMREEKRQLQLDKERIEEEKQQLNDERTRSHHHLEAYMDDYQRQTTALSNQVRDMEKQKHDLVSQVEDRLEEGNRASTMLAQRVQQAEAQKQILAKQQVRKNFRDFEQEMEDYEPVEEEDSEDGQSSIADVVDSAQLPVLPAHGQIDYYRHIEGDEQHWMQQITPRAGGDSMLGQHDMEDDTELQMEKNATAHYEVASIPPSRYDDQMENGVVEAEFQEMTSQLEAAQSEEFQQRSEAEMEIDSDVEEKEAVQQDFFEPERAIFSQLGDKEENESHLEFYQNITNPVFEQLEKPPTRHAVQQEHFVNVVPQFGEADPDDERFGDPLEFIKQEPPTYGEVLEEGEMERNATAQHFFNPERATQGDADDAHRSGLATPQSYFARTQHHFGDDVEDPNTKEAVEQRLFNQGSAAGDDVSNIDRTMKGSEIHYQDREEAYMGRDLGDDKVREGTEQQFFQREEAMYSQDKSLANKNATQSEFFKHDEAVRGEITSQDRSVAATQHQYFGNIDKPSMGRPDSFDRLKSDIGQEYMNKSDLGGRSNNRHEAGVATPHGDRLAEPIDYMNKSEAEYGRQSSVHEADATQQEFFDQEKNPEFGRGENYTRNVEEEREYNPTPVEDSSGRSESHESDIADHQPFTSNAVPQHREGQDALGQPRGSHPAAFGHEAPQMVGGVPQMAGGPGPNQAQHHPNQQYPNQQHPNQQHPSQHHPSLGPGRASGGPSDASYPAGRSHAPDDPNVQQVRQVMHGQPSGPDDLIDAPQASLMASPQKQNRQGMPHMQQPQRQPKAILYSDKSETSVEDLMDDTPSNYNIQNGRFEGKSLGLKALLLHARNYQNQTLDALQGATSGGDLVAGLAGLTDIANRSPQHARPGPGMLSPGMLGAQKGIIGSQNDERRFVNELHKTGQSSQGNTWRAGGPVNAQNVPVIGEESSNYGEGPQQRNTRNQVKTNKQFQEDPRGAGRGGRGGRPPQGNAMARSPNVQQMGRGAPRVTKNNYFGGST